MNRVTIINRVGTEFHISNIKGSEFSYVKDAGSKEN